jgi:hypothetical protein
VQRRLHSSGDGLHHALLSPEYTPHVRTPSTILATAAVAAIGLGTVLWAADAASEAFTVGVLRRDGVIIPFAAFDGKRWSNAWPPPALNLTVPIGLRAVPSRWWGPAKKALATWQALLVPSTDAPRTLNVVQPDWVEAHCERQIGLRTDYVPAAGAPPRTTQPYPKDGVAVSPPHAVQPIAIVPPLGPDAQALAAALLDAFNRSERVLEDRYGHAIKRRAREGVVPAVEAVYSFGDEPRVYYVEATRQYRELGETSRECSAMAFGTGWFVREGGQVRSLLTVVDLLSCDRAGASYMLPLGAVAIGGRLFWLAQFSGWDHERFAVLEIKAKTVEAVLSTWGGGC